MVSAPTGADGAPTRKLWAIEGLRAWLAWTVVFAHIVQICGIDRTEEGWWITQFAATQAVFVFVIISGFVIANVVVERRERWISYITRRSFRIFPIYLLVLPWGAASMYFANAALAHMSWSHAELFKYDDMVQATIVSVESAPFTHWASHLVLAQGLIPDSSLDNAQTSFLGPAWSLSLEWQFYLIAPALVVLLAQRWSALITLIGLVAGALLFRLGAFGAFELPSFFPAVGYLFALGIVSRHFYPALRQASFFPAAAGAAFIFLGILYREMLAIALWGAFLAIIAGAPTTIHERTIARGLRAATQSPLALWLGARSFAIYLVHWPIIQTLAFLVFPLAPFNQWQALMTLTPLVAVVTLLAADVLHKLVERPMIRLGAHVAARLEAPRVLPASNAL